MSSYRARSVRLLVTAFAIGALLVSGLATDAAAAPPGPLDPGTPSSTMTSSSGGVVDVFAGSSVGQILQVSGPGLATTTLRGDGTGRYFGRLAFTGIPPAEVTVSVVGELPPTTVTVPLVDRVVVSQVGYDADTRTLSVQAASSDAVLGPSLSVDGFGPLDAAGHGVFTGVDAPPATVTVLSDRGGRGSASVFVSGAATP